MKFSARVMMDPVGGATSGTPHTQTAANRSSDIFDGVDPSTPSAQGATNAEHTLAGSDAIDGVALTKVAEFLGSQDGVSDDVKDFLTNHADLVQVVDESELQGNDSMFKDGKILLSKDDVQHAVDAINGKSDPDTTKGVANLNRLVAHEVHRAEVGQDQYDGMKIVADAIQGGDQWHGSEATQLLQQNGVDLTFEDDRGNTISRQDVFDSVVKTLKADSANFQEFKANNGGDNAIFQLANGYDAYLADEQSRAADGDGEERLVTDDQGNPLPLDKAMENLWNKLQTTGLTFTGEIDPETGLPSRRGRG
jgi:hypothetical protein